VDFVSATNSQATFDVTECKGSLVGFWSPAYAKTLNIPGYHLHLISDDKKYGGHVLTIEADELEIAIADEPTFKVALPESSDFLQANMNFDPELALAKAEGAK